MCRIGRPRRRRSARTRYLATNGNRSRLASSSKRVGARRRLIWR
jgi:hypothetical protein